MVAIWPSGFLASDYEPDVRAPGESLAERLHEDNS
jgi:hypothetical protein